MWENSHAQLWVLCTTCQPGDNKGEKNRLRHNFLPKSDVIKSQTSLWHHWEERSEYKSRMGGQTALHCGYNVNSAPTCKNMSILLFCLISKLEVWVLWSLHLLSVGTTRKEQQHDLCWSKSENSVVFLMSTGVSWETYEACAQRFFPDSFLILFSLLVAHHSCLWVRTSP